MLMSIWPTGRDYRETPPPKKDPPPKTPPRVIFRPGYQPWVVLPSVGRIGLSICYDLPFSVLYRDSRRSSPRSLDPGSCTPTDRRGALARPDPRAGYRRTVVTSFGGGTGRMPRERTRDRRPFVIVDPWFRICRGRRDGARRSSWPRSIPPMSRSHADRPVAAAWPASRLPSLCANPCFRAFSGAPRGFVPLSSAPKAIRSKAGFANSSAYDQPASLQARPCHRPSCGNAKVGKAIMAPHLWQAAPRTIPPRRSLH